jgi:hypothetical protein
MPLGGIVDSISLVDSREANSMNMRFGLRRIDGPDHPNRDRYFFPRSDVVGQQSARCAILEGRGVAAAPQTHPAGLVIQGPFGPSVTHTVSQLMSPTNQELSHFQHDFPLCTIRDGINLSLNTGNHGNLDAGEKNIIKTVCMMMRSRLPVP